MFTLCALNCAMMNADGYPAPRSCTFQIYAVVCRVLGDAACANAAQASRLPAATAVLSSAATAPVYPAVPGGAPRPSRRQSRRQNSPTSTV